MALCQVKVMRISGRGIMNLPNESDRESQILAGFDGLVMDEVIRYRDSRSIWICPWAAAVRCK